MQTINVREMCASIGQIDQLVDEAGELIITRQGKAIARILPIQPKRRPSHIDLRNRTKRLSVNSEKLIRMERDEQ